MAGLGNWSLVWKRSLWLQVVEWVHAELSSCGKLCAADCAERSCPSRDDEGCEVITRGKPFKKLKVDAWTGAMEGPVMQAHSVSLGQWQALSLG